MKIHCKDCKKEISIKQIYKTKDGSVCEYCYLTKYDKFGVTCTNCGNMIDPELAIWDGWLIYCDNCIDGI